MSKGCIAVYKSRIEGAGGIGPEPIPVAIRPGDTPVPIPNTTVKARTAKSTLLETAREDRRLQDFKKVKCRKAFTYIDMSLTSKASKCSIAFGIRACIMRRVKCGRGEAANALFLEN